MIRVYQICAHCNHKAFEYIEEPKKGEPLKASMIKGIYGETFEKGDIATCSHCNKVVPEFSTAFPFIMKESIPDKLSRR